MAEAANVQKRGEQQPVQRKVAIFFQEILARGALWSRHDATGTQILPGRIVFEPTRDGSLAAGQPVLHGTPGDGD